MSVETEVLSRLYPLDTLQPPHLGLLAEDAVLKDFHRGEVLFEAGDTDGRTLFLLAGKLVGHYADGRERDIDADSPNMRYAIGDLQPRRFTARVTSAAARVVSFDRDFLEKVLTWDQISREPQFALQSAADSARWVFRMLRSRALLRLPAGNVQRMFERFEEVPVQPGTEVVREGEAGDYFYVIKSGTFEVLRREDGATHKVADLRDGDSFGEDALISNAPRNATVVSRSAASLMRLSKRDFADLLKHPVVDWVTPGQASALLSRGGMLLDVRLEDEYRHAHLKSAINTPLAHLREAMHGRDASGPYVVYCATGERSASAAFILNKLGFRAWAIRGGLTSVRQLLQMTGTRH